MRAVRPIFKAWVACAMLVLAQQVQAWGHQGHMVVGALADQLLTAHAQAGVQADLGLSLAQAAPWADCVKSVSPGVRGLAYAADERRPSPTCARFETPQGIQAMQDYVARNWDSCGQRTDCHKSYHFTDVAYQHSRYRPGYVGANAHDVVHAVRAALAKLQGRPVPAPFSIASRAEALLLLVHFVGDLHQPLHVGAVFLDAEGQVVDPDAAVAASDAVFTTRGGNSLEWGNSNLHAVWDDIPDALRANAIPASMLQGARAVRAGRGNLDAWLDSWTRDTLAVSREAFAGMHFNPAVGQKSARTWQVVLDDETAYRERLERLQVRQLTRAGAHLAQLLNALYP